MPMYTDKETVTRVEFLALERLLWLARRKREQIDELVVEMREITGEAAKEGMEHDTMGGHSFDAAYDRYPIEALLSKLGLRVEDKKPATESATS